MLTQVVLDGQVHFTGKWSSNVDILRVLEKYAVIPNPDYYYRAQTGLYLGGIPKQLALYKKDENGFHAPVALWARFLQEMPDENFLPVLYDTRTTPDAPRLSEYTPPLLREVQQEIKAQVDGHTVGVVIAPTGAGKTLAAAGIIAEKKVTTLVLVNRIHHAEQWKQELSSVFPTAKIEVAKGGKIPEADIVCGVVKTIAAATRKGTNHCGDYGLIIVDEAQYTAGGWYQDVLNYYSAKYRFGITAEAKRKYDGQLLIQAYCGPVRYSLSLQDDGVKSVVSKTGIMLPQILVHRLPYEMAVDTVRRWSGKELLSSVDRAETITRLTQLRERNQDLLVFIRKLIGEGRKVLVCSERVEHVDALSDALESVGVPFFAFTSALSDATRDTMLSRLRSGQLSGVVGTYQIIEVGTDIPILDTLVLATPKVDVGQVIGRVLRSHPGKPTPIVHDFVDVAIPWALGLYNARKRVYQRYGTQNTLREALIE